MSIVAQLGLLCLICSCASIYAIVIAKGPSEAVTQLAVQGIERLYNHVLYTSIEDCREELQRLNDSKLMDQQYFDNIDTIFSNEDFYSTQYFLFVMVHSQLISDETPDKLLMEVLPKEKIAMRKFFTKVEILLKSYLKTTDQNRTQLMQNVTRWQSETENKLVLAYLEFPESLQVQLPELKLMNYYKQAKVVVESIIGQLAQTLLQPSSAIFKIK